MRISFSVGLAILLLAGCGAETSSDSETASRPVKVRVAELELADSRQWTLSGTVQSQNEAALGFRLPGQISERLVHAGEHVEQGQVLLRLDARDINQQLASAQADVASSRVQAENAEANRRRLETLRKQELIPAQVYEDAKAAAQAAAQGVKASEAALAQAQSASGYVELKAPADGVLVEVNGEVGQVVAAGQTLLRLAYDGPRDVEVYIPEVRRSQLPEQAKVVPFGGGEPAPASLREIAGSADPLTRSWRARFAIAGAPAAWSLGSSVTLVLSNGPEHARSDLQKVPIGALIDQGKGMAVWQVENQQVHRRQVQLVRTDIEHAYVRTDLPVGALIIALGAHLLEPGQQVEVLK
ncbi:MAG TPA: efflux RND transporter periplasmic adaptor subunit [Pseudomonas xinjiangensis]|uniref:Efflux RND transporter periplasmic adaptor subunit n=2 Tax=root TaxID=1 RepID=A0A7V1FQU1_9GAMM|nr:efflux RND transporter periplasmic adaptor subunit [Halopseudomonas xinjiangensis]HEC47092.1 efflux RND transporter periplasmic adaptor subunit [Halopseudomonas xinjiangensis]